MTDKSQPLSGAAPTPNFSEWIDKHPHCCLRCGFTPIEGMKEYLLIHGEKAKCCRCGEALVGQKDPYPEMAAAPVAVPAGNFVSDYFLPSCHVCGEMMKGVCPKCGTETGVTTAPLPPPQEPAQVQIPCSNCDGQGFTPVTMDMAIDAGDRAMAGSTTPCGFCNGQGFHLEPEPQCNGPFSDAFDCPVHDPRKIAAALAGETRTEAQDFTIQVDINGTLKIWPPRNWSPDEFAQYITKAIFDAAAAASRIAQLREKITELVRECDQETERCEKWMKRAETAEAALTQAQQEIKKLAAEMPRWVPQKFVWCEICGIIEYEVDEMKASGANTHDAQDVLCPKCRLVIGTFHESQSPPREEAK